MLPSPVDKDNRMKLIISVRRSHRDEAPKDWIDQIQALEGIAVNESSLFGRIVVEVHNNAEEALRIKFGEYLHIEPFIEHKPMSDPTKTLP